MENYLEKVNGVRDLKALSRQELKVYAAQAREYIISTVCESGGHLASNLGAVELTLALHYVYNAPEDKIVWDVGHQCYTHKLITGRRESLKKLRQNGGISGFPKMDESDFDAFTTGHSSTALSAGLGIARARELKNERFDVISVVGDGAFTGGMAFEAINDIGASSARMVIVLNDNKMSISKNVGALSKYLAKLRTSKRYTGIKYNIKRGVSALPFFSDKLVSFLDKSKDIVKAALQANKMFEYLGIKYYGPFDGHDVDTLIDVFHRVKNEQGPVLVHLITQKGKGYAQAECNPQKFHGVSGHDEKKSESFSQVFGTTLCGMAEKNDKVVAITAAMLEGTGLVDFGKRFPDRCFDVGIAEQHAVTMAAGLAASGMKPYFAVYSSFLQRGYDQILHDVCINNLPVTFAIDRAGAIGADGVTHQGLFDLSYLGMIPNMTICAPKDGKELAMLLEWSQGFNGPLAIRYPKSFGREFAMHDEIVLGKWEFITRADNDAYILACGNRMLEFALSVKNVNIVNVRFVKPLDEKLLKRIATKDAVIVTLEDNVLRGGLGESVRDCLEGATVKGFKSFGFKDGFVYNYDVGDSFAREGITPQAIEKFIREKTR